MAKPTSTHRNKDLSSEGQAPDDNDQSWVPAILEAVGKMRFGTIQIFVQDWKVAQIERVDRVRLEVPKEEKRKAPPA